MAISPVPKMQWGNICAQSAGETAEGGETAMNLQQFGVTGLSESGCSHHCARGSWGPTSLGGGFYSWGLFHHGCLQFSSCCWLPKLLSQTTQARGEAAPLHPCGCSLISNPSCWSAQSRDSVMEMFSAITPSCICWGPLSPSSTAPRSQTLLGLLWPSALIVYLRLSHHNPSCAWLGCPQPPPDALFQDGRFPHRQRVMPSLLHEQSQGILLMFYAQL